MIFSALITIGAALWGMGLSMEQRTRWVFTGFGGAMVGYGWGGFLL